jgi:xanthine dehydrogenase accessory factor
VKDIYEIIEEFKRRPGQSLVLASLVRVVGSSYRRPGARMLICDDGKRVGSLSAGCVEDEVVWRAREVLQTGEPIIVSFDTRRRFGCAGNIDVFIERVSETFFPSLVDALDRRGSCFVVTGFGKEQHGSRVVRTGAEGRENDEQLIQKVRAPIQLLIFGDGPDNAPLCSFAGSLGWETVELADANSLSIEPDEWTAAIVKSHNYGRDFAALEKLLPMNLRYVGLIGPRKRRDQMMNHLLDLGITVNAGFFAPAGLELGAETSDEIALSIISEIQRVFAKASGDSLQERKTPIHATLQLAAVPMLSKP